MAGRRWRDGPGAGLKHGFAPRAEVAEADGAPREVARLVAKLLDDVFADFDGVEFEGGDRGKARATLAGDLAGPLFRAYCDAMGGGLRAKNSESPPSAPAG